MASGIICESNPAHKGHAYLIERAKQSGDSPVVCLMSGNFVQRGDTAIADASVRAELLMRSGADLVLEFPYPFCASGSEYFASAGVNILTRLGVDTLWFGSESGDLERLKRLSDASFHPRLRENVQKENRSSVGTAKAYFDRLSELSGEPEAPAPNEVLGIAYLSAIRKQKSLLIPKTAARIGSGYSETDLTEGLFPSATGLRKLLCEKGIDSLRPFVSEGSCEVLEAAFPRGFQPRDLKNAEQLILGWFRLTPPERFSEIAELSGGLGNRMQKAARSADSLESFLAACGTKKYPTARIRRGILYALCGVTPADLRTEPAFVRLLASNEAGKAFLSSVRRTKSVAVITKPSDLSHLKKIPTVIRQLELEEKSKILFALSAD